ARLAEEDVEPVAIDERRTRRVAVVRAFALVLVLGQERLEFPGPEPVTRCSIQAEEMPAKIVHFARFLRVEPVAGIAGDEDPVAVRYRARRPGPRQLHAPRDVLLRRPLNRQALFITGPEAARTTELPPVSAVHGADGGRQDEQAQGDGQSSHEIRSGKD